MTWLYLIVDIIVFRTSDIFFYYQFRFKLTRSSIFKSSETLSRFAFEDLSTVSMILNAVKIRLIHGFLETKLSSLIYLMIFEPNTFSLSCKFGNKYYSKYCSSLYPWGKNIFGSIFRQYFQN